MKSCLLTSFFLISIRLFAFSQPTITASTFPSVGDTLRFRVDQSPSGISLGQPGSSQIWDFSALSSSNSIESGYAAASSGQASGSFPSADLVVIAQNGGQTYYKKTATKFLVQGYAGPDPTGFGLNVITPFSPAYAERRAPLTFGSFPNIEKSDLSVTFPTAAIPNSPIPAGLFDSLRVKIKLERIDFADAWGQVKIQGGNYNCLREKRFLTNTSALEVHSAFGWIASPFAIPGFGTDTTITYNYFSPTEKGEIAVVTVSNDETEIQSVRYKDNGTVAIFEPISLQTGPKVSIQAYPNPAIDYTNLICSNVPTGDYQLKIYNIIGDVVWRENHQISGSKTIRVDLEKFRKGPYLYSICDSNGNLLATKRMIVLKP